uniref:SHSP domain-containing protein n=1 Tax=Branchiostoma floridae TaxID=7739 RepID=C3Y1T8_BRAFL|eukprot:XP_002609818.1 hypothetical protein BRAFLDRAFT_122123 [Branchiostoma floridae]
MAVKEVVVALVLVLTAVCGQDAQWEPFSNPFCSETGSSGDVIPMLWHRHPWLSLRHHPGHGVITPRSLRMHPLLWSPSLLNDIDMATGLGSSLMQNFDMATGFPHLCTCQTSVKQEATSRQQDENPSQYHQCQQQAMPGEEEKEARRPEPSSAAHGQQQQDQQQEEMEDMIQKESCKGFRQSAKNSPLHAVLEETDHERKVEEDGRRDWKDEHLSRERKRLYENQQDKLLRDRRDRERIKAQQERQQWEQEAQARRDAAHQRTQQRQSETQQRSHAGQQSLHNAREPTSHRTPPKVPMSEVASVQVNGYYPENIQVRTEGKQLIISGKQTCRCDEPCFEKEFERQYPLPRGLDTRSLQATLNSDGQLRVEGRVYRGVTQTSDVRVEVQGVGLRQRPQVEDPTCGGRKSGFRLRKTAQRRKSATAADATVDVPRFEKYQDEEENDGVTIEVVEE